MVLQTSQFGSDNPDVLGAFGDLQTREFLDRESIGPVVGERAKVIEAIRVWHRAEVGGVLSDFLMIAVKVTEHRLELHNALTIEHHVHSENSVGGRMLRTN